MNITGQRIVSDAERKSLIELTKKFLYPFEVTYDSDKYIFNIGLIIHIDTKVTEDALKDGRFNISREIMLHMVDSIKYKLDEIGVK